MIVQVASAKFSGAASLPVPFASPTRKDSVLAVAFTLDTCAVTIIKVDDDKGGTRWWRLANDTAAGRRRVCWVRNSGAPPGVVEVVGSPANDKPVTGTALALEAAGVAPGAALQLLADLTLEVQG